MLGCPTTWQVLSEPAGATGGDDLISQRTISSVFREKCGSIRTEQRQHAGASLISWLHSIQNSLGYCSHLKHSLACPTIGVEPQVIVEVLDLVTVILTASARIGKHKIGVSHIGIPDQGLVSAFFCLIRPVQAEKRHPQDNVT